MNKFHEFTIGGCAVDVVFIHHEKCDWYWDTGDPIPLPEILKAVSEHVCEEKPE